MSGGLGVPTAGLCIGGQGEGVGALGTQDADVVVGAWFLGHNQEVRYEFLLASRLTRSTEQRYLIHLADDLGKSKS